MGNEQSQLRVGEENLDLPDESYEYQVNDKVEAVSEYYKPKRDALKSSQFTFHPCSSRLMKEDLMDEASTKPHLNFDDPVPKISGEKEIESPRNIEIIEEEDYSEIVVEERETLISSSSIAATSEYLQPDDGFESTPEKKLFASHYQNTIYDHTLSNREESSEQLVWKKEESLTFENPLSEVYDDSTQNRPVHKDSYIVCSFGNKENMMDKENINEKESLKSEQTLHASNVMMFGNKSKLKIEEDNKDKGRSHRNFFGTDLWFTWLGMSLAQLCDPKDPIVKEGKLYRYKPGLNDTYITRWCQITKKVFRVYKNQMCAKGFGAKPILAIPLYALKNVKKSKFKTPKNSKMSSDSQKICQNQFELTYKDEILTEIMMEFLESKCLDEDEEYGNTSERVAEEPSHLQAKLEILKCTLLSNEPFKIDSKTQTLNNNSSWSNREGEWFLAEKRLLFSTKSLKELNGWLSCWKKIFSHNK
ncbi:unnamed protein product [Moneuplotes crassus]|uniref:PH domain-containing protein n=1 Tax=Euplotes crassus TaxID=5936 RepID=A0AAD1X9V6_EUPCR|nr:unnamed protein product [Moneuplotes crassus]